MSKNENTIREAEEFIKQYRKNNVILTSEAQKIMKPMYRGRDGLISHPKELFSLADLIANEVFNYEAVQGSVTEWKEKETRDLFSSRDLKTWESALSNRLDDVARKLLKYVELARANNVLAYPNLSLKAEQFDTLEKEHEKLNGEHTKLLKLYNELLRENKKLVKDNKILNGFDRKDNKRTDIDFESGVQGP